MMNNYRLVPHRCFRRERAVAAAGRGLNGNTGWMDGWIHRLPETHALSSGFLVRDGSDCDAILADQISKNARKNWSRCPVRN